MKSLLPVILVILMLTGAITYVLTKSTLPKVVDKQETVSPNELEAVTFLTPTATVTPTKAEPSVTPTPTKVESTKVAVKTVDLVPTITIKNSSNATSTTKGGESTEAEKVVVRKTTKTTVCTPVYGMASTCTEHVVVDTGVEQDIFFNLAGIAYLTGLVSFVKAKKA